MFNTPKNTVEFRVWGKFALFTDPITKLGGEKCSYQIPTYEAVKGITESIYWKPTFIWIIDKVRVMKSIEMEVKGVRTLKYYGGNGGLYYYTYLKDVEYQVQAHFEWNENMPELKKDQNDGKHFEIAERSLEKGGRRDIFLGTRECQGYVEPCKFGESVGYYDNNLLSFGSMFYNFGYPNETGKKELVARIWLNADMKNGIIDFTDKNNDIKERIIKPMQQENQYL
ncbi:type I-C CRISPR-associated protein Cas5c [Candidatus Endomicrobiellum agilis]|uniref:type I-C CRISPR-associated protein Cas5c n=1 Tax=Candidatus Endomicrobiellum agilis TaxID=3238957 RepID=UPI003589F418|nr:type I-C CRISPR-associated protein Cas5c [Endomicrobium sp.]